MKTHTIRIERNASITWRIPCGRAVGWGNPAGLADILRRNKGKYRLDLNKPLSLKNLKTERDVNNAYELNREHRRNASRKPPKKFLGRWSKVPSFPVFQLNPGEHFRCIAALGRAVENPATITVRTKH